MVRAFFSEGAVTTLPSEAPLDNAKSRSSTSRPATRDTSSDRNSCSRSPADGVTPAPTNVARTRKGMASFAVFPWEPSPPDPPPQPDSVRQPASARRSYRNPRIEGDIRRERGITDAHAGGSRARKFRWHRSSSGVFDAWRRDPLAERRGSGRRTRPTPGTSRLRAGRIPRSQPTQPWARRAWRLSYLNSREGDTED